MHSEENHSEILSGLLDACYFTTDGTPAEAAISCQLNTSCCCPASKSGTQLRLANGLLKVRGGRVTVGLCISMAGMLQVPTVATQRGSAWSLCECLSSFAYVLLRSFPPHTHIHSMLRLLHAPRRAIHKICWQWTGSYFPCHDAENEVYLELYHLQAKHRRAMIEG